MSQGSGLYRNKAAGKQLIDYSGCRYNSSLEPDDKGILFPSDIDGVFQISDDSSHPLKKSGIIAIESKCDRDLSLSYAQMRTYAYIADKAAETGDVGYVACIGHSVYDTNQDIYAALCRVYRIYDAARKRWINLPKQSQPILKEFVDAFIHECRTGERIRYVEEA